MNIGMVLDNEFTGDLRVENEVMALRKAGFNVTVLCLNFGTKPGYEEFYGARIVSMRQSENKIKKLRALTNTVLNLYPGFWSKLLLSFIDKYKIDVLHVHDLYMFGSAFLARKKCNRSFKIVGDLHENYVEGLKHYRFSTTFPGNILISIPKWERTEIMWINKLDYAITVIEEAVERYKSIGIDQSKFSVVPNYLNIDSFDKHKVDEDIIKKYSEHFVLIYIGAFDTHRGIESVIEALPILNKSIHNLKLVLVGDGQNMNQLQNLAEQKHAADLIDWEGWQPPSRLSSYAKASNICLIPHLKTVHTDNTIPHKLFQYMFMKRPVVASDCNPLLRIINETNSGLIYQSNNPEDLADKIFRLYHHPGLRDEMGVNGNKAVIEKYNWNAASRNLVELYKSIVKEMVN